jgi:hypothetical protein
MSPPHVRPGETHTIAIIEPENGPQAELERDEASAATELRPVQLWLPDTSTPSFAETVRRQCLAIAAAEDTLEGREEAAFWDGITADAWDGLE